MVLPYYNSLSRRQQAIYRKSDAVGSLELAEPAALAPAAGALAQALSAERAPAAARMAVGRAASALSHEVCRQFAVEPVEVRIRERRPRAAGGELHGLYEREPDKPARITLWMRTAQRKATVAFRTFLRTLLHELCHHLDYAHLELADSLHTEGFFRRESSLARQILAALPGVAAEAPATAEAGETPGKKREAAAPRKGQLKLPGFD